MKLTQDCRTVQHRPGQGLSKQLYTFKFAVPLKGWVPRLELQNGRPSHLSDKYCECRESYVIQAVLDPMGLQDVLQANVCDVYCKRVANDVVPDGLRRVSNLKDY